MKPYQWIVSLALLPKALRVAFGLVAAVFVLGFFGGMCSSKETPTTGATPSSPVDFSATPTNIPAYPADNDIWAIAKRFLNTGLCEDPALKEFSTSDVESGSHQIFTGGYYREDLQGVHNRKIYNYMVIGRFDVKAKGKTVRAHFGMNLRVTKSKPGDRDIEDVVLTSNNWMYLRGNYECMAQKGKLTEDFKLKGFTELTPHNIAPEFEVPRL